MALSLLRCGLGICTNRIALTKMINVRSKSTLPGGGGGKQTESEMKFNPGTPSDKFINRRKTKFYERFASTQGKTASFVLACAAATAVMFKGISSHTFLIDKVKDLYQTYKDGLPVKLCDNLKDIVRQVLFDLDISDLDATHTRAFVMNLSDAFAWGSYSSKSSTIQLGLPFYFNFDTPTQINLDGMHFFRASSDPQAVQRGLTSEQIASPECKSFKQALVLSEDAKKFAIAREMHRAKLARHKWEAFMGSSLVFLTYFPCKIANNVLNLFRRPPIFRIIMYVVAANVAGVIYVLSKDLYRNKTEKLLDELACKTGTNYARGGVEYYDKILTRHVALRTLMPEGKGKQLYNLKGDFFPGLIRTKLRPVSLRRDDCKLFLSQLQ